MPVDSSPLSLDTNAWGQESLKKSNSLTTSLDTINPISSAPESQADPLLPTNPLPVLPVGSANPNPNPYLTSAALVPDFNGDGKTDKLWVNAQTGEILVRLMNGTQVLEQASLGQYDLNTWDYKTADFNGENRQRYSDFQKCANSSNAQRCRVCLSSR